MISGAIREQNDALTGGLESLENLFRNSQDAEAVTSALLRSHDALDALLDRDQ